MKARMLTFALLLAVAISAAAQQQGTAKYDDPLLAAMSAELQRSTAQLKLQELARPYYVEYAVTDTDEYNANATFGALRFEMRNRIRFVRVVVRIGDYKQDSYFGSGEGTVDLVPRDDEVLALRHQLWLATDNAYKNALEAYTQKESMLKNMVVEQPVDDFSREAPVQIMEPVAKLDAEVGQWRDLLKWISAQFLTDPKLDSGDASASFRARTRYFMNSEGTVARTGLTTYLIYFGSSTQAPDGMQLERSHDYTVAGVNELPAKEKVQADLNKLMASLKGLRDAPLVEEEYRGPVLLTGDAAQGMFWRLFAPHVAGERPEPGNPARTTGEYAGYFKSRVLPEFFSVVDDPTMKTLEGKRLLGAYAIDDEGVTPQAVTVVEKGRLVNYLVGRQPIRDFPKSNGHGRASPAASPRPEVGNLIIRSLEPLSADAMQKRLAEMCRDSGREYCYHVDTVGPDLAPRLIYRVYVADGRRELVRGAVFSHLDTRALRNDIVAAGGDLEIANRAEPIPSSIAVPSVLFGELELRRANRAREKLPQYDPPAVVGKK